MASYYNLHFGFCKANFLRGTGQTHLNFPLDKKEHPAKFVMFFWDRRLG